jgi:dihydrodipicolinate synthase/N-acetylneuraminate lyase
MLRIGPINAASPTPLDREGCFDRKSARCLAKRWLDVGLDGVLILGSMGEGLRLSDEARDAFVEAATEEAGDRVTIFASAADTSREKMRERALRYARMGVHCVVLCIPPGVAIDKAVADVKAVADSCPVPCGYYEIPLNTGTALTLDEILDILSHDNIRAMKDSSNNALISQAITSDLYRPHGVSILDGVEYRAAFSCALGYDGVMHGGGVLTARRVRCIWQKASEGRMPEAAAMDRENSLFLGAVYNRFSRPLQNVIGQKYALKLLGILDHETVLLDQYLDEASKKRVSDAVEQNRSWL